MDFCGIKKKIKLLYTSYFSAFSRFSDLIFVNFAIVENELDNIKENITSERKITQNPYIRIFVCETIPPHKRNLYNILKKLSENTIIKNLFFPFH